MIISIFLRFFALLVLCATQTVSEQSFLGTHFYVNHENILVDNTLKTVSTLARPYDLVAFIRQSERLARVDHLQTAIDAVDDIVDSLPSSTSHDKQNDDRDIDRCHDFIRDGESLIFKVLKTNLYDQFHIPLELTNRSVDYSVPEKAKPKKILTCNHFCQIKTNPLTFDQLPSISTRYDEQQIIRVDDDELTNLTAATNHDRQALWATHELSRNRTSWLAYVQLGRYFYSNASYHHAIDCLRCALVYGTEHNDVALVELANIVFRYGYIRDAIVFIEKALDYHLRSKTATVKSLFTRAILHYYLGNLCTIDNRFVLAIQFYNRTKLLLERVKKSNDEQQIGRLSSSSLGPLSISSLLSLSQQKIDALRCHLTLELSLQNKHQILQSKLAQLNQLRSITDELIQLNAMIKRDMSSGPSFLEPLQKLREEQQQIICDWKRTNRETLPYQRMAHQSLSARKRYSTVMKQRRFCLANDNSVFVMQRMNDSPIDLYECRPRDNVVVWDEDMSATEEQTIDSDRDLMARRLAASERTQSSYVLEENAHVEAPTKPIERTTLTSTTTWPTLTSRLPTEVVNESSTDFLVQQSNDLYPPLEQNAVIKLNEQQFPSYIECQMHYYGLPTIGDYPTVWLPLENKGISNIKQAFYQGLNYQHQHYPLPWSPPLCTLQKPINERLSIIENHPVLRRSSRAKAPGNRFDTNMLLNLYLYIDSIIDEQLPIEEFGQRLRAAGQKHEHLLPEWILYLLSSLYWRVNGHLPNAIDCGLKAHETIIQNSTYKRWSDVTLINLANILYLWGKYEDALDLTQQAHAINSHEPTTNYFLGNLVALTKNNHTAAQEYYRRAIAIDPGHIHARRQLRLSYCRTMHTTWETMHCSDSESQCDERTVRSESMKRTFMLSAQPQQVNEAAAATALAQRDIDTSSYHDQNAQCQQSLMQHRSSVDRWLNRSSFDSSSQREELLNDARRAYRLYGLCSSNEKTDECSQAFAVTNHGYDIGHILINYDDIKQLFQYSFVFSTDYENIFVNEGKRKCLIFGTGRKSTKCRDLDVASPNDLHSKHNMTWWRDPSTLYEHLKELIEIIDYEHQLTNRSQSDGIHSYEKYFSDQYLLAKERRGKYFDRTPTPVDDKIDCRNASTLTFTSYLSTWISPQTKNILLNNTFFKQLHREQGKLLEPVCSTVLVNQTNGTANVHLIDYILGKASENLSLYRAETILRPILTNLIFERNPTAMNKAGDDKVVLGSFLAAGLTAPAYNTSWLYFHTLSLYWRLVGNASQSLACLLQSHVLSPPHVYDFTYLSMALILYNSQIYINEAVYLLYESLAVDAPGLLLTHFTLGNAMARKGHLDDAEQWYRSTLRIKADFEPAKQRLRAIHCSPS